MSNEQDIDSRTPLVNKLRATYKSRMSTNLRIWKLAASLEIGNGMLRAKVAELERERDEALAHVREARRIVSAFTPLCDPDSVPHKFLQATEAIAAAGGGEG